MVSEQAQQLLGQAQVYQQQVQGIMAQKNALSLQVTEIKKALEDLERVKETEVYKISGPILIKTKKSDVKKELNEKLDIISTRIKTLERGEKKTKTRIEEIRDKITKTIPLAE